MTRATTPQRILVAGPKGWHGQDGTHHPRSEGIEGLLSMAEHWGVSQLWVHESALDELGLPQVLPTRLPAPVAHPLLDRTGAWESSVMKGLTPHAYWYRRGGNGIDLHVPAWAPDSPFRGLRDPGHVYAQANMLGDFSGGRIVWKGTATITSDAMVRAMNRALTASPTPPPVRMGRGGELAFAWTARDVRPEAGLNSHTCYAFDLNLAYLNGASSLALGCGDMVPAVWDEAPRPGWWRIEVPNWDANWLPAPWQEQGLRRGGDLWVTLPTAKMAVEFGAYVREGWVYPESHRYLDGWYKVLRDARKGLLHSRGAAYEAVKQVAQHGLGRMGSPRRKLGAADPLYQPYWREAVIAEMRTRLLRRLLKLKRRPVAIDVDCCYFLTNAKTPESFADWAGIPLGDGLGEFKVAGSMRGAVARDHLCKSTPTALDNLRKELQTA